MIMKTKNIFRFAAVILTAVSMLALSSCEEPDEPDVPGEPANFPDLVENYDVAPGSTLTLTFMPNYKWELSVPSETLKYFWILDGSFKVDKLSGSDSEEPVTVQIVVSEEEEFDNNRSCEVTLRMNEESKVIAKYMRPAKNRTLAVYAARTDADGNLQTGTDGTSYVYGDTEASSAALVWSAADADFRLPVKVDANCEWTVSVPEWLEVEVPEKTSGVVELVFKGVALDGASGKVTFMAGETALKEMDVTVPSCKGVSVWEATMSEGEFEYGTDGYVWTAEPVDAVNLAWLGTDFRMPVKIASKCDWTLEMPEWLTAEVPAETAGELELTFMGIPSKYPLEDTVGKIVFKFGESVLHEIPVKIPGCEDIFTYSVGMSLTELAFNAAGEFMTATGYVAGSVSATIFGASNSNVLACEKVGGKYVIDSEPDWIEVTVSNYVTSDNADVLQERSVSISVSENDADRREAVIFFVPHYIWGKFNLAFTDDLTEVRDEFKQFVVPVSQLSNDFLITMVADEETMNEAGAAFVTASDEKREELTAAFGATDQVYVLTYDNIYAREEVRLFLSRPFSSVKVFDADKADCSEVADFWLSYTGDEASDSGIVDMYFNTSPDDLPPVPSIGYVVFYDSFGSVLGIIECVSPFKEVVTPPDEGEDIDYLTDELGNVYFRNNTYFADPEAAAAAGAEIYELTSGRYYEQYKEFECPILLLEYSSSDTEVEIVLPSKIAYWNVYDGFGDYIVVNDETLYETSGIMGTATDLIRIRMTDEVYTDREAIEETSINKHGGLKITFHKNMMTQDPTVVIFCRLNLE